MIIPRIGRWSQARECICDDEVAEDSPLRLLYDHPDFRGFVAGTTGQAELHPYARHAFVDQCALRGAGARIGLAFRQLVLCDHAAYSET